MDNEQDRELFQLLNSYTVADADEALLDRIVAQTQMAAAATPPAGWWVKSAAMLAATVVLGFWLGSASLSASTQYVSARQELPNSVNLDKVIFGPKTIKEVTL